MLRRKLEAVPSRSPEIDPDGRFPIEHELAGSACVPSSRHKSENHPFGRLARALLSGSGTHARRTASPSRGSRTSRSGRNPSFAKIEADRRQDFLDFVAVSRACRGRPCQAVAGLSGRCRYIKGRDQLVSTGSAERVTFSKVLHSSKRRAIRTLVAHAPVDHLPSITPASKRPTVTAWPSRSQIRRFRR